MGIHLQVVIGRLQMRKSRGRGRGFGDDWGWRRDDGGRSGYAPPRGALQKLGIAPDRFELFGNGLTMIHGQSVITPQELSALGRTLGLA